MVGLCYDGLVRLEDHARLVHIHMQSTQDEDEPGEGGVGRDGLQPVIVDIEEHHLGLCCLQNQVSKLLNLQSSLHKPISHLAAPTAEQVSACHAEWQVAASKQATCK